ncbi:ParB N-terminal domain-containing protein [Streptomyces sp. NPDC059278]|uniref:ParB N-terminal domain-containing protein n=1 Tax=Streptomyces sp. NPDC059278 TaxID=3346801 RepID=UPI00368850EA
MTQASTDPVLDSLLTNVERLDLSTLNQFPGNPRIGNVEEIAKSLKNNGQFAPIIVQKSTRYILAGNHTTQAADSLGWTHLDGIVIDVKDQEAKRIVAADNRTGQLGSYNDYLLAELLQDVAEGDHGLDGTGYDEGFLDDLLDRVEPELPATDDTADDGGHVISDGPSGAHYAETEEQESTRGARVAGERSLAAQGLAEMVMVMNVEAKSQLLLDVEGLRDHLGDQPTGPLIHASVRIAKIVLEAAHHNSPPLEWDKILGQAAVRPGEPVE